MPYEIDLILNRRGRSFYDEDVPHIKLPGEYDDLTEAMDTAMEFIKGGCSQFEFRIWDDGAIHSASDNFI
ncbi:hypothetical protein MKK55_14420 [Methylobacterium sp. J-059]|uniref:hypothetical protein n=1 Tax=Methylobacterium sp. J-059 TaxID=2836643 RepID=UPI001FBB6216|nr:hypothetical protein [Methylobacterium sp. J-059]MCJ2040125.1 hypothetical protein [Methylobacterium sp. J-059]